MEHAFSDLEPLLKALSNPNRLMLLDELREPKTYGELELRPTREDSWGSGDRTITRQAVRRHVQDLVELGVITPISGVDGLQRFVTNHAKLFAVVERLRRLATISPTVRVDDATAPLHAAGGHAPVSGAQLVLVRGVAEGISFPLNEGGEWTLGRAAPARICLDYDPYVSTEHARILRKEGSFFLLDLATNKNGTYLNWSPMVRGGIAPLRSGDIVGVGMSLLVFRA